MAPAGVLAPDNQFWQRGAKWSLGLESDDTETDTCEVTGDGNEGVFFFTSLQGLETVSVKCWAVPNAFPVQIVEPFPLLDYVLCSLICKEQNNLHVSHKAMPITMPINMHPDGLGHQGSRSSIYICAHVGMA